MTAGQGIAMYGPCKRLVVLRIVSPEEAEIVFNGPGDLAWASAGTPQKNGQRVVSLAKLRGLAYAKANGFEIVATSYDAAVSGADPVTDRPGFAEMLERLIANGARTIIVESPDQFARLMVQLAGHDMLKAKGISLIAASAPTFFVEDSARRRCAVRESDDSRRKRRLRPDYSRRSSARSYRRRVRLHGAANLSNTPHVPAGPHRPAVRSGGGVSI